MQYVLTEAEYEALREMGRKRDKSLTANLQAFCTRVANEMPIKFWGREEATPWRCILTSEQEWYCDECPAKDICPHDGKEWSK